MATKNDITGDLIKSKTDGQDNYRDNYDKIFGKKNKNKISQDTMGARKPFGAKVVPNKKKKNLRKETKKLINTLIEE